MPKHSLAMRSWKPLYTDHNKHLIQHIVLDPQKKEKRERERERIKKDKRMGSVLVYMLVITNNLTPKKKKKNLQIAVGLDFPTYII